MKEDKHLARILARLNIDPSKIQNVDSMADQQQEAEAAIQFIKTPKRFSRKKCGECGSEFATDYGSVGYCFNRCRKAHLESLGIQWDYNKSPWDRWGYRLPLQVGPDALKILDEFADAVIQNRQDA